MMKLLAALTRYFESNRLSRIVAACLIIAAVFAYLLMASWHKWGDLVVDTSRELWIPQQLLAGKVLYKDIYYFHGFLPVYLLAFIYKLSGVNVNAAISCGISITILMSLYVYKVSRIFLDEVASCIITINYLVVFAFGVFHDTGIFNFILPYSFASTFCMLFIVAALFHFMRYLQTEVLPQLVCWSIFLSLAFLSRPELTLSVWFGFAVSGFFYSYKSRLVAKSAVGKALLLISPIIISMSLYCIFLWRLEAFAGFKESFIGTVFYAVKGDDAFAVRQTGLGDLIPNVLFLFKSLLVHLVIIVAICFAVDLMRGRSKLTSQCPLIFQRMSGVGLIAISIVIANLYLVLPDQNLQFRCIPILLIIGLVPIVTNIVRNAEVDNKILYLTIMSTALILTLKIFLSATPKMYGFFLLVIGLICYYVIYIELANAICRKYFTSDSALAVKRILYVVFTTMIFSSWSISEEIYNKKDLKITTDKGLFYCPDNPLSNQYWNAVDYLLQNAHPYDGLVVLPEGASLNYFSGIINPTKYYVFLPGDIARIGEADIVSQLDTNKVKYIALIHRTAEEGGFAFFGIDYAVGLSSWIYSHYDLVKQFGAVPFTSDYFGIVILRKKN